MTAGYLHMHTRANFIVAIDELQLSGFLQRYKIIGAIAGFRSSIGLKGKFPFTLLHNIASLRISGIELAVSQNSSAAGMIKMQVRDNYIIYVRRGQPQIRQHHIWCF
ncbi:MAG: hypothetical protein BWY75_03483 [bacterium ADurb.Bin425]|nr:MAG: hypothetical protein BWY75_03483 [bacterium ADurb.Bin425]